MILAGYGRERVSGTDRVVAHCGGFGGSACSGLLLGLFLCGNAVFFIRTENLVFVVYALDIPLVGIEVPGANLEEPVPERTCFKIYEPGGVKSSAPVSRLKVKVRASRAPGGPSKADYIPGIHPVSGLDVTAGKMAVECLQAVGVTDYHKVSVAANVFRYTNLSVKGGRDRGAGRIRQVYALMTAPVTVPVLRSGMRLIGAAV